MSTDSARPGLNRTIWTYWDSGFDAAPEVVQVCLESWRERNPGWAVVALSDENLTEYVDDETLATLRSLNNITIQKFSNLLRFYLMARHGGVWVDATCYCAKPLDSWILGKMRSGFFAFRLVGDNWLRNPKNRWFGWFRRGDLSRIVASWFLAAEQGNPLCTRFFAAHLALFRDNSFARQGTRRGRQIIRAVRPLLERNSALARIWAHPIMSRVAQVYPYFIVHYHFARVVSVDPVCKRIWSATPVFRAFKITVIGKLVLSPLTEDLRRYIDTTTAPMHKLSWKRPSGGLAEGRVLDYLASTLRNSSTAERS